MAEDDEIDILGDFSFNSCLAQNTQGIPSCSSREDTVHPQWLQDSVSTNWYDNQLDQTIRGSSHTARRRKSSSPDERYNVEITTWSVEEKQTLAKEMAKYGRNVRKISQTLKTKTEAEIQALIEAEHGVHLDTPTFGMEKHEELDNVPSVVQEEIVTDDVSNVLSIVSTGSPTIPVPKTAFKKKKYNTKTKNSLLKSNAVLKTDKNLEHFDRGEIFYGNEMTIGSFESVGHDESAKQKMAKQHKEKVKAMKKIGNHRRKVSRSYDRGRRNKSKEALKSPLQRRKDSSLSEDSTKSPKMQIVLGSGQALPVSEGEQVIKIEKKKESEPESDIEIDIDSDQGETRVKKEKTDNKEEPIAVPLRKLQPMPKRQKKFTLSGDGGYTIMHTAAGDLFEVSAEPRKERAPKKPTVHLIHCLRYNADMPAPCVVSLAVSCLVAMDVQAHTSRGETMGLAGGRWAAPRAALLAYRPARAATHRTHCDMDPVSQAMAAESLRSAGLLVLAWHHSHPAFPPEPSALDLRTQRALQRALERHGRPLLGFITSQHWAHGRRATHYRCIRVEDFESDREPPAGYQLNVQLTADITPASLPTLIQQLRDIAQDVGDNEYSVDMRRDVCPQAGITYLEKCISSISHHMCSAGYEDDDPVLLQLLQGVRDVFR